MLHRAPPTPVERRMLARLPRTHLPIALPIVAFLLVPTLASAQDGAEVRAALEAASVPVDTEMRNMRAMGMGGAFVAGGSGAGGLYHNPASLLSAAVYEGNLGYQRNFASDTNAIGVSVVDAKTNPSIAAGFGYSFGFGRDPDLQRAFDAYEDAISRTNDRVRNHDIRAGLAFPIVPRRIGLGVGLHYVSHFGGAWRQAIETEVQVDVTDADGNPTGETETQTQITTEDFEIRTKGLSLDGGVVAQLTDSIGFGFAARNLLEIDGYPRGRRLESGLGGYFDAAHVEIAWFAEQQADDSWAHGVAVGFEYVIDAAPVRVGYRYDNALESSFVTSGFGIRSETVGGDIGFEQNLNDTSDRRLGATLALYF